MPVFKVKSVTFKSAKSILDSPTPVLRRKTIGIFGARAKFQVASPPKFLPGQTMLGPVFLVSSRTN